MRDRRVFLLDVAAPRNGNGNSGSSGAAAGGSGGGAGGPAAAAGSGEPAAPGTPEVLLYPDVARARGAAAELAAQLRQLRARQLKAEVGRRGWGGGQVVRPGGACVRAGAAAAGRAFLQGPR